MLPQAVGGPWAALPPRVKPPLPTFSRSLVFFVCVVELHESVRATSTARTGTLSDAEQALRDAPWTGGGLEISN